MIESISDYPPLSPIPKSTAIAGLVPQETVENYKWLIRIECAEFEKELLDIVSDNFILFYFFIHIYLFAWHSHPHIQ